MIRPMRPDDMSAVTLVRTSVRENHLSIEGMAERGWAFIARAGTVIFAVTIVIWALTYYPRSEEKVAAELATQRAQVENDPSALAEFDKPENLDHLSSSLHQRHSFLGRAGQWIEPAVRPLGWDWRIGCAAIASFPAREVVMGVLGVIYQMGGDVDVGPGLIYTISAGWRFQYSRDLALNLNVGSVEADVGSFHAETFTIGVSYVLNRAILH